MAGWEGELGVGGGGLEGWGAVGAEWERKPAGGCGGLRSLEQAPDFTASRRLSMACRAVGRPLVLVLGAEAGQASTAATTRWQISAAPHNSWQVHLQRLRGSFKRPPPMAGWQVFPWRETLPVSDDTVSDNTTPESVSVHATAAYCS